MKKLPVIETTKYAYKFLFANFGKLFPMFVQYSGVVLSLYTLLYLIRDKLNLTQEGLIDSCIFGVVNILIMWAGLPFIITITRAIIHEEEIGKNFFSSLLSFRLWRAFLTFILVYLLSLGATFIIGLFILALWFVFQHLNLQPMALPILSIIFIIFGIPLLFYIYMRLSLSLATAALDYKNPIRRSWKMAKGSVVRLFGTFILTFLPYIIYIICFVCIALIWKFPRDMVDTNPLGYALLSLPGVYLTMLYYAGAAQAYKHLSQFTNGK